MFRTPELAPREFYVLSPHWPTGPGDRERYDVAKFTVERSTIARLQKNIRFAGETLRVLARLTYALLEAGILYPSNEAASPCS
jgi:hypothetical protein